MKHLLYPTLLFSLLLTAGCEDDDAANYVFPARYDASSEIYVEAQRPRENKFLRRIHRRNGADLALPSSESPGTLNLPFGRLKDFDPSSNVFIFIGNGTQDLAFRRFNDNGGSQTDFLSIDFPDIPATRSWHDQIMFGHSPDKAWINFGKVLVEGQLNSFEVVLLTDSLSIGRLGLSRMLLDPAADKLYYFGRNRTFNPASADSLIVFNATDFSVEARVAIRPVTTIALDPASGRLFGLTVPVNGSGFRLAEIIPSNPNTLRIISPADLAIDGVSPDIQAIHTASNSLVIRIGDGNIEGPMNTLISINLDSGEIIDRADVLPGHIITGIFAE